MTAPHENLVGRSNEEIKEALSVTRRPVDVAVFALDNWFNFGAIVRICHNFQVNSILGVDFTSYYRKADMGTRKYENIIKIPMNRFKEEYGKRNIVVFESREGLSTIPLYDVEFPENPILFFGSEKHGVPDEILEIANMVVSIPMYGVWNDHNVAVACGIALYDWSKKFRDKGNT